MLWDIAHFFLTWEFVAVAAGVVTSLDTPTIAMIAGGGGVAVIVAVVVRRRWS